MLDQRAFLGVTLGGLTAMTTGRAGFGQAEAADSKPEGALDTLFLTWQRDPTTTMTVQWIGSAAADDPRISFGLAGNKTAGESAVGATKAVSDDRPAHLAPS